VISLQTPPKVRLLDSHTVNQIAAGEVVERPSSVVKELVENAIDAGATRIVVELRETGRECIRVVDDGCGMSFEDALCAIQRHATSKIGSVDDLSFVSSLGFRGEALPSIASVSNLTLSTGTGEGARHVIRVRGGAVDEPTKEAGAKGTEVLVEDLFFNTPARL
jgi:DNA mismatch repair protein MutL